MQPRSFEAELIRDDQPGAWTYIRIPFSVEEAFGKRDYPMVKGTIDGKPFSGIKLMNAPGKGQHFMPVNDKLRKAIGKSAGQSVSLQMELDTAEAPALQDPEDFRLALEQHPKAKAFYDGLTPASKKWFILNITEAKQEQTRRSRIEKAIQRLDQGKKFHD